MTDHTARRIPEFRSIEEEAAFWDAHSVLDYLDEFGPPQFVSKKHYTQGITVRFEPDTLIELRAVAQEQGIGPTTLLRMWVIERLKTVRHGQVGK